MGTMLKLLNYLRLNEMNKINYLKSFDKLPSKSSAIFNFQNCTTRSLRLCRSRLFGQLENGVHIRSVAKWVSKNGVLYTCDGESRLTNNKERLKMIYLID